MVSFEAHQCWEVVASAPHDQTARVYWSVVEVTGCRSMLMALANADRCSSKGLRSNPFDRKSLFISVRKPHKPVKAATIGHWLKSVMHSADIDTNIFSAYLTRGAATSKAKSAGVSAAAILKAASWSSMTA